MPSDLTPEVLAELERMEKAATPGEWAWDGDSSRVTVYAGSSEQLHGANIVTDLELVCNLRNHARALIQAARELPRLRSIYEQSVRDQCDDDTAIREMCDHRDDGYTEPLPDVVRKVVSERDRLRAALVAVFQAERMDAAKIVADIIAEFPAVERERIHTEALAIIAALGKDGNQCFPS